MPKTELYSSQLAIGEIDSRIQRRYLDRLNDRVRLMRQYALKRNWTELYHICRQLQESAGEYGFEEVSLLAGEIAALLPRKRPLLFSFWSNPIPLGSVVHRKLESLFMKIDDILTANAVHRA